MQPITTSMQLNNEYTTGQSPMSKSDLSRIFGTVSNKSRPVYETQADRNNEQSIIKKYCDRFGLTYHKQPKRHVLDYALFQNRTFHGFAEVKKRSCKKSTYSTYLLSRDKWDAVRSSKLLHDHSSVLIVQWIDGIGFVRLDNISNPHWVWGGRTDRNDADDQELCALINITDFTDL